METPMRSTTNLEQALAHPGSLIAAWGGLHGLADSSRRIDLCIFALENGRLNLLHAETDLSADRRRAVLDAARARGARTAAFDGWCRYVWTLDGDTFCLWATKPSAGDAAPEFAEGLLLQGDASTLRFADGSVIRGADVRKVEAFIDRSYARRGVRLDLSDGSRRTVAREEREGVDHLITYGWDDMLVDAAWARGLAMRLSDWLNVPLGGPLGHREPLEMLIGPAGGWQSLDEG